MNLKDKILRRFLISLDAVNGECDTLFDDFIVYGILYLPLTLLLIFKNWNRYVKERDEKREKLIKKYEEVFWSGLWKIKNRFKKRVVKHD